MKNKILTLLKENGTVDLETSDHLLTIWFKKFFGTKKEFMFQLNSKAVDGCKSEKTALKKIGDFIDKGFRLIES